MKIFLSHSSIDKPFIERLNGEIGYDWVTFDKYSFEAGEKLTDSIRKGIEGCDIFVLFISKNSIDSVWVKEELEMIAPLIVTKGIKFLPYCIDEDIKMQDERLPSWVWDRLVVYYPYHKLLARVIQREIKREIWKKYPESKQKANLFVGRHVDMDRLERIYYSESQNQLRAVFVSGFPLVGRKTLLKHFVNHYILQNKTTDYHPVVLNMKQTDSIEQFVLLLNEYIGFISNDKLLLELSDGKEKALEWCRKILNVLWKYHERVIIEDDTCIVKPGGGIEEWFMDIVHMSDIPNATLLFVASRYRPCHSFVSKTPLLMEMPVSTLSRESMYNLFKGYLDIENLVLEKDDMDYFVDNFTGFPKQAVDMVGYLCSNDIISSRKHATVLAANYDGNFNAVMEYLSDEAKDLLFLLAKFDFISCDLLQEIFGSKDISQMLDELNSYSLYDMFGLSRQYISLNHSVTDYIVRIKQKVSKALNRKLQIVAKKVLSEMQSELTDLSSSLLNVKMNILNNITKMDERYLIPSFVLKVIVEEYHAEHDKNVVDIATKLIHDYKKVNYASCIKAIHYWMCCSLCRKQDRDLFEKEVEFFNSTSLDYYYLQGFYHRHSRKKSNLENAKYYYETALHKGSNNPFDLTSIAKVEHEMVIVLTKLDKYKDALVFAKRNYENNPHNTYHIRAYFNCLANSVDSDIDEIRSLLEAMRHSQERGVDMFVSVMEIQCSYYIDQNFQSVVRGFRKLLAYKGRIGLRYAIDTFRNICRGRGAIQVFNSVIKETGCDTIEETNDEI